MGEAKEYQHNHNITSQHNIGEQGDILESSLFLSFPSFPGRRLCDHF
jgi:hypothetical protein